MWALGVLYFSLLTGKMPFHAANEADLNRLIKEGKYSYPTHLTNIISKDAKKIVQSLL